MMINCPMVTAIPLQAMLNHLQVTYHVADQDCRHQRYRQFIWAYNGCRAEATEGLFDPDGMPYDVRSLSRLFKETLDVGYGEILLAYMDALDYAGQLDRWQARWERLPQRAKLSPLADYLDEHLKATILQAETTYQRNEAVGLNLAKSELLEKQLTMDEPLPRLAVAGLINYFDSGSFRQALADAVDGQFDYYFCYTYQSLLYPNNKLTRFWQECCGGKHRYFYRMGYSLELNDRNYDAILLVGSQEALTEALGEKLSRVQKPRSCYQETADAPDGAKLGNLLAELAEKCSRQAK